MVRKSCWAAACLVVCALVGCTSSSNNGGGATSTAAPAGQTALPTPASDAKLAADLKAKLAAEPSLKGEKIDVAVKDGRAVLSGTVSTSSAKQKAEDTARSLPEVNGVDVQNLAAKE